MQDGDCLSPPEALDKYREALDATLQALVPRQPRGLYAMLRYHLGWVDPAGNSLEIPSVGKALRPTLCFLTCEALGAPWPQAATAAATLELIHNFSLIHDDIQDGDTERRGRPTVWSLWGVGQALWAGNALRVISDQALDGAGLPPAMRVEAAALLTGAYLEMIEGQYLDLAFEGRQEVGVAQYLAMIARKTGALLRCSVEMGALVATGEAAVKQALRAWGTHLGLAFQVRDDILGIWGDPAVTGKAAGNDIRRRKKTYPVVFGFEHASADALQALRKGYDSEAPSPEDVQGVLGALTAVRAYQESQALVNRETELALEVLDGFREHLFPWAHRQMVELTKYLAHRDK